MKIKTALAEHLKIYILIQKSIPQLCAVDHRNDPHNLRNWLNGRPREQIAELLNNENSQTFICISEEMIVGVSQIRKEG